MEVIQQCLSDLLGTQLSKAMNFYLDPNLAASAPALYARRLQSLAGLSPGEVIIRRIESSLCKRLGVARSNWSSFEQCINQLEVSESENRL